LLKIVTVPRGSRRKKRYEFRPIKVDRNPAVPSEGDEIEACFVTSSPRHGSIRRPDLTTRQRFLNPWDDSEGNDLNIAAALPRWLTAWRIAAATTIAAVTPASTESSARDSRRGLLYRIIPLA
jgi:hypothetical protein